MFVKYNAVLRGLRPDVPFLRNTMVTLCCPKAVAEAYMGTAKVFEQPADHSISFDEAKKSLNKYTTTLHCINSAIVKLGKLTKATKIYRGVAGMKLPDEFWKPNDFGVKGGVENGFMSTTLERDVAMGYAEGDGSRMGIVLEVQQGMVNRGADISWLSQYPHEKEILFGPLTGIEVLSTHVDGQVVVVECGFSVNLRALTIEQVLNKLQGSHLDLIRMFSLDFFTSGVPAQQLEGLTRLREAATKRDGTWFNDANHFQSATAKAFEERDAVLRWMVEGARLKAPWPKVLAALGTTLEGVVGLGATTVRIAEHGFREDGGHTEYQIETQLGNGTPVVTWRRYSDIHKYHQTRGLPHAFPVTRRLFHTTSDKENRCGALERYLREVVRSSCHGGDLAFGDAKLRSLLLGEQVSRQVSTVVALAEEERLQVGAEVAITAKDGVIWEFGGIVTAIDADAITVKGPGSWGQEHKGLPPTKALCQREDGVGALLREAAAAGKEKMVEALLFLGASPFAADARLNTALHLAAVAGHVSICQRLLDKRADHRVRNAQQETAWTLALSNKHNAVRRLFLPTPSDREFTMEVGKAKITALMVASRKRQLAAVEALLRTASAAMLDAQSASGYTALHLAAEEGDAQIVEALLARDASVALVDADGWTALMRACYMDHAPCAKLLLEASADAKTARPDGSTALKVACMLGHVDCAKLLLEKGADVAHVDCSGATPLEWACQTGHADCARLLLDKGANLAHVDSRGDTALMPACQNGHADCARLLLDKGADPESARPDGTTALKMACLNGHANCVGLLLGKDADTQTALIYACYDGYANCVQLLLEKGVDVQASRSDSYDGYTALIQACNRGHANCVQMLLDKSADTEKVSRTNGWTALMLACKNGHADCVKLLCDKSADTEKVDMAGNTALVQTCMQGHANCVRVLLEKGADIETPMPSGGTALGMACNNGHAECVRLLLDQGANTETVTTDGFTALMAACRNGHTDCVQLLLDKDANVNAAPASFTAIAHTSDKQLKHLLRRFGARG